MAPKSPLSSCRSTVFQITAEYIFASLATLSEFVVFLYMGMGVFTGRFRDWDWRFIGLAIVFCLVARLFNTFPFSALANLWCVRAGKCAVVECSKFCGRVYGRAERRGSCAVQR